MNKIVDFEGIGYVAATFPVDDTTKAYLVANHTEATTGNVDINGKQLAVKLNEDGTVGFGTGSAEDALLGIIMAYEMDGFASVQVKGGVDNVPASAAIKGGKQELVVTSTGAISVVAGGKEIPVVKPATTESLYASIIL
jgi:hypothetical protein